MRDRGRSGRDSRGGGSRFSYKKRSSEDTDKRKRMSGDRDYFFDSTYSKYTPSEGDNCNRLLPPTWDKPDHYGYDVYVHYGVGPDNAAYLCLDKMKGEPCPPCEERQEAYDSGDQEYADELKWSHGLLVLVIDRKAEKDGPQLWLMPLKQVDGELLIRSKDKRSGDYLYIDDPYEGYDFDYYKGKNAKTGYPEYTGVEISRSSTTLGTEEQVEEWLKLVNDKTIPSVLKYYDYDHIAQVCAGKGKQAKQKDSVESEGTSVGKTSTSEIWSYEDIMEMQANKLADFAFKNLGFKDEELDNLSDEELREQVIKELGVKKTEDTGSGSQDSRLSNMRERYSGTRSHGR